MSMELDHSFTVPVPPDRAWEVLLDVERIAPCMPGATVEEFDGEVVTGRIKVKVGPVSLTYRGTAKFTERDPDARVVVVDASGKETRGAGTASAAVRASLQPSGEGTQVSIHTTMNVTGQAQFGRGVIAEVGGKLVEKFAENLAQMISDGGVAPDGADASAAPDGASAVPADVSADAGAADAGAADAGAASSTAGTSSAESAGDGSAVNSSAVATDAGPGSTESAAAPPVRTATVPPAGKDEDSINLVRLVGPAVLKRVLPVVVGIVALALVSRRWRHLRHRGEGSSQEA